MQIFLNSIWHEAPTEVIAQLQAQNAYIWHLTEIINEYRMTEYVARLHPTKENRIKSWQAKQVMFNGVITKR